MLPVGADEPITTLQWRPSAHLSHVCSTPSGVQWGHTGQHCCTNSEPIILAPNHPQFIGEGGGHTSLALAEYAAHSLPLHSTLQLHGQTWANEAILYRVWRCCVTTTYSSQSERHVAYYLLLRTVIRLQHPVTLEKCCE